MLGWMLSRNNKVEDAPVGLDTTLLDQPDTPAPIFAARAFKSAIFGQPNHQGEDATSKMSSIPESSSATPSKPQGILLTPGTGASRRKRVSFNRQVAETDSRTSPSGRIERQRQTTLKQALENSRRSGNREKDTKPAVVTSNSNSSDEWEEADDDEFCSHDVTVDLDEPHSKSGRYWKEQFEKYHSEAVIELDKMLQYKRRVKDYARERDTKAMELAEMLRDEQGKVVKMEKQIAESAANILSKAGESTHTESPELLAKLAKQTTMAAQYRHRVQELEGQLEAFEKGKLGQEGTKDQRRRETASPRTHKTLIETQRELRRARSQVKENGELKTQIQDLKSQLQAAKRTSQSEGNGDAAEKGWSGESDRVRDLRAQLREAKDASRRKDRELKDLKREFESFRRETEAHETDTNAVLQRANSKISDLKKDIKALKAAASLKAKDADCRPQSWAPPSRSHELTQGDPDVLAVAGEDDQGLLANQAGLKGSNGDFSVGAPAPSLREKYRYGSMGKFRSPAAELSSKPLQSRGPRAAALTAAPRESQAVAAPDPAALSRSLARQRGSKAAPLVVDDEIDLLQDRFAALGGPETSNREIDSTALANTSRSNLPPERYAAAMARIQERMAEKKRARSGEGLDKENVRPHGGFLA